MRVSPKWKTENRKHGNRKQKTRKRRTYMTTFTIDWQQPKENAIIEIGKNHFKFNPLNIRTKEGCNFEMDARMVVEIDDDSIIIQNFGSFSVFVGNTLSAWVRNFFTYKERDNILSNRLKIQEELMELLQEYLTRYGVKVIVFMIVYTSMLSSFVTLEEPKTVIRDAHMRKNVSQMEPYIIVYYGLLGGVSFVLLSIAILLNMLSINIDIKVPIILCIIISIITVALSICQYSKIER